MRDKKSDPEWLYKELVFQRKSTAWLRDIRVVNKKEINKLKAEKKTLQKKLDYFESKRYELEAIRTTPAKEKYFWSLVMFPEVAIFLEERNITLLRMTILVMINYYNGVKVTDLVEWMLSPTRISAQAQLMRMKARGYIVDSKAKAFHACKIYMLSIEGKQIIDDYCKLVDIYSDALFRAKKHFDNETTSNEQYKQRMAEIRRVFGGPGYPAASVNVGERMQYLSTGNKPRRRRKKRVPKNIG